MSAKDTEQHLLKRYADLKQAREQREAAFADGRVEDAQKYDSKVKQLEYFVHFTGLRFARMH